MSIGRDEPVGIDHQQGATSSLSNVSGAAFSVRLDEWNRTTTRNFCGEEHVGEAIILRHLFGDWLSLATEYAKGAPDIRAVYVFASSERIGTSGTMFANAYFDQGDDSRAR